MHQDDSEELDEMDSAEEDDADEPWLLRLVPESELRETGRATPTGIHLALFGPDCAGLDAWALGELWGYSPPELEALRVAGDHLVAVLYSPDERCGRATAESLAELAAALRPEAVGHERADVIARALACTPAEAEQRGLRKLQRQAGALFGLRDGVFGARRVPRRGADVPEHPFYLDEKLLDPEANGLLPGSSLPLEEYPELPTVVRLPWDEDEDEDEEPDPTHAPEEDPS